MSHSMPKTFPEIMNIILMVNCTTKTFQGFQTITELVLYIGIFIALHDTDLKGVLLY